MAGHILSRQAARLVLVFRFETASWRIVHSGISIPYPLGQAGEVYPLKSLQKRNRELELLVEDRTRALMEANNHLEVLSNTDSLTGIANRRSFDSRLTQEWKRAQRARTPMSLIMLTLGRLRASSL